jgi:hydrogenase maturation protease
MMTLILALGNPILSDDAVGWEVADRLAPLVGSAVTILKEGRLTLDLIARLGGYDRLVVIDAIQLGTAPVGTVHRFTLADFRAIIRSSSAHDLNFATAFETARQWGYPIPGDIRIYGIEVENLRRFAEGCTPAVQVRLDAIAAQIYREMSDSP